MCPTRYACGSSLFARSCSRTAVAILCWVDLDQCRDSNELFYRANSNILGGSEYDSNKPFLYYSYSTCGGSADEWIDFTTTLTLSRHTRPFRIAIPQISPWNHYKRDETTGEILASDAPEYYNNSHPWLGITVDYFNAVLNVSNIPAVIFTHRSVGSAGKGYSSIWTQAVTDVEAGIADLAISSFWITSERCERHNPLYFLSCFVTGMTQTCTHPEHSNALAMTNRLGMTPFTVPIIADTFQVMDPCA